MGEQKIDRTSKIPIIAKQTLPAKIISICCWQNQAMPTVYSMATWPGKSSTSLALSRDGRVTTGELAGKRSCSCACVRHVGLGLMSQDNSLNRA